MMSSVSPGDRVRQLLEAGDVDDAERVVADAGDELRPWDRLTLTYRIAGARKDFQAAEDIARQAVALRPDLVRAHDMLVFALNQQGRFQDGLDAARIALETFPDSAPLLERAYASARALDAMADTIDILERLVALGQDPARWHAQLGRFHLRARRGPEALHHLSAALDAGHDRAPLLSRLAVAAEMSGHIDEAAQLWRQVQASGAPRAERAGSALERLTFNQQLRAERDDAKGTLEALLALEDDSFLTLPGHDVAGWRRTGSTDLVLIFGGMQSMMGIAPPAAPMTLLRHHRLNILSFSDPSRRLLLGGVPSLAADYDGTIEQLRGLIARWGVKRVMVIGYSMGGYTALKYALDLKAEKLLLMSGGVMIPPNTEGAFLADVFKRVGRQHENARDLVVARGMEMDITLAYGAENSQDAWQASHLAGLPNVTLRPLQGVSNHALALEAEHDGVVADALGTAVTDPREPEPPAAPNPAYDPPGEESQPA